MQVRFKGAVHLVQWLFIIFIVALAVGPLMWIMPSKQEQKLARFRARANSLGLQVEMGFPDLLSLDSSSNWACYRLSGPSKENRNLRWWLKRENYHHEIHFAGVWNLAAGERSMVNESVLSALEQLPDSVQAVGFENGTAICCWLEVGDSDSVDKVHAGLSTILGSTRAQPV